MEDRTYSFFPEAINHFNCWHYERSLALLPIFQKFLSQNFKRIKDRKCFFLALENISFYSNLTFVKKKCFCMTYNEVKAFWNGICHFAQQFLAVLKILK